jgi:Na+/proline symporter
MMTEVPHILKGFLIVAILSAAMSSISSAITSLASVSTMDFVKQIVKGGTRNIFSVSASTRPCSGRSCSCSRLG